jgi:hypothetical protein
VIGSASRSVKGSLLALRGCYIFQKDPAMTAVDGMDLAEACGGWVLVGDN